MAFLLHFFGWGERGGSPCAVIGKGRLSQGQADALQFLPHCKRDFFTVGQVYHTYPITLTQWHGRNCSFYMRRSAITLRLHSIAMSAITHCTCFSLKTCLSLCAFSFNPPNNTAPAGIQGCHEGVSCYPSKLRMNRVYYTPIPMPIVSLPLLHPYSHSILILVPTMASF